MKRAALLGGPFHFERAIDLNTMTDITGLYLDRIREEDLPAFASEPVSEVG